MAARLSPRYGWVMVALGALFFPPLSRRLAPAV